jgi:hypothetical protein
MSDKESSRFLKKAAQKLFLKLGLRQRNQHGPSLKKFFCFFLFTKRSLPLGLPDLAGHFSLRNCPAVTG